MKLSAPSLAIFLTSTVMIGLIIGAKYFGIDVPILATIARVHPVEVALAAWFLLFIGVAFNL
jgi:hypothetical protein